MVPPDELDDLIPPDLPDDEEPLAPGSLEDTPEDQPGDPEPPGDPDASEELDLAAELDLAEELETPPEPDTGPALAFEPLKTQATPKRDEEDVDPFEDDEEDEEDYEEDEPELSTPVQGTTADGQIFEGRIVQEMDLATMPLELGHRVNIKPGGLNTRTSAVFVGMEQNSYLILRLSGIHADLTEVFPLLYAGNEVKLFFTDKGVLKGFLCNVIAYKASPFRHLYLSYPHKGEFFTLRQQDRFLCHLPASLELGTEQLRGMVQDLSLGGCSVNMAHHDPQSLDLFQNKEITLGFSLLSAEHVNLARCRIKNMYLEEDMVNLGLSFEELDDAVVQRITHFLDFLSRYRGTRENSMR